MARKPRNMKADEVEALRFVIMYADPKAEMRWWELNGKPELSAWTIIEKMIDYHNDVNPDDPIEKPQPTPDKPKLAVSRYDQEEL